jgi:hypothetical protein
MNLMVSGAGVTPAGGPAGQSAFGRELERLLADAPLMSVPFFGDYQALHEVLGDRLVVEVDPRAIQYQLPPSLPYGGKHIKVAEHFLGRGLWKAFREPLEKTVIDREVADLLASGGRFRDTLVHAMLLKRLQQGRPMHRNLQPIDSEAKLDRYFDDLWTLITSIRDQGYRRRPRYAGVTSAGEAARHSSPVRSVLVELTESEVGVAVGRDGRLYRAGPGHHRMAIARHLGLTRIPVELRLFHVKWLRPQLKTSSDPVTAIIHAAQQIAIPKQMGPKET